MTPIQHSINFLINTKCAKCNDNTFCKLKKYYKLLENPTLKELDQLTSCLFYQKKLDIKDILTIKENKKIS